MCVCHENTPGQTAAYASCKGSGQGPGDPGVPLEVAIRAEGTAGPLLTVPPDSSGGERLKATPMRLRPPPCKSTLSMSLVEVEFA